MINVEQVRKWRRDLHQIPECRLDLPKTNAYVKEQLKGLDCEIVEPIQSSVLAYFKNGSKTTIAFRSDMDALPVLEETGAKYASKHEGKMHACGHDGHMAMLIGFAHELNGYYTELPFNVLLIFQPAEEGPGGAQLIVDSGVFEKYNVTHVFGTHLWPYLPEGVVATRPKEFMARSTEVHLTIIGKTSHAAKYHEGIDALEIGAKFINMAYAYEASIPKSVYRLLRFGIFYAGTACNIVSAEAKISGTLRAFEDSMYYEMCHKLEEITHQLEMETGCTIKINFETGYPAVINDIESVKYLERKRDDLEVLKEPVMISEDFSYYQQKAKGVFFFLGTGTGIALHNSKFDFNEEILLKGIENYIWLSKQKNWL